MSVARRVAEAICTVSVQAGQAYAAAPQSVAERAANLLRDRSYHAYIIEGDPLGWANGRALATLLLEPKGGSDDCAPPLDYYNDGIDVSIAASQHLGDVYIEFVNPAVACVWPVR